MTASHPRRGGPRLGGLVLGGLALVGAGASAAAQQCHTGVPERVAVHRRAWWATVATVATVGAGHLRDQESGFLDVTRGYQTAALVLAGGWRRLGARLTLGGSRVDQHGAGIGDLRAAISVEVTPRAARVSAGASAALAIPTGDADTGRGMGHVMVAGGAWARVGLGRRTTLEASTSYARAVGDGAVHAAHLHGSALWPLVDPMNAVEVATTVDAAVVIVPERLTIRAGALAALPVERGARRVVASLGARLDRGPMNLAATISRPVVGDPFVARGQVEVGYRF